MPELGIDILHLAAAIGKDEGLRPLGGKQEGAQGRDLPPSFAEESPVLYHGLQHHGVIDILAERVPAEEGREAYARTGGQGCRTSRGDALRREPVHEGPSQVDHLVGDEPVSFVQHEPAHPLQHEFSHLLQLHQPARGAHDDLRLVRLELVDLARDVGVSGEQGDLDARIEGGAEEFRFALDLGAKLEGRSADDRERSAAERAGGARVLDALQDGNEVGEGLAGSGSRSEGEIPSRGEEGDDRSLHFGRLDYGAFRKFFRYAGKYADIRE